jgi:hypothetical protein
MPRIRTVKPEFWSHPIMGRLAPEAQLLALALLNFADDEGFFLADPNLVRSNCRPFDDDSSRTRWALAALVESGWIEVVEHPTHGPIGRVVHFTEHQKVDRPNPSKLRGYFLDEGSTNLRESVAAGKEGKGREGKEESLAPAEPPKPMKLASLEVIKAQEGRDAFERVWSSWPIARADGQKAKGHRVEAEKAFQKLLDARMATVAELEQAATLYLAQHENVKNGYPSQVATFFGPKKGLWLEAVRFLRRQAEKRA